jgi:hypothetical protein
MKKNGLKIALAFCLAAGLAYAGGTSVMTGHHVLSAMATADANCNITYTGNLDPEFKGIDTVVSLLGIDTSNPGGGTTLVGSTLQCDNEIETTFPNCTNTIDKCSGKFSFTVQASSNGSGGCVLPGGPTFFFTANVSATYRSPQQCNAVTPPPQPDPGGTAPCSGGCTP